MGWIGVDFDKTLATYDHYEGIVHEQSFSTQPLLYTASFPIANGMRTEPALPLGLVIAKALSGQ